MSADATVVALDIFRRQLATWRAIFALHGYELNRLSGGGFRVALGTWSVDLATMEQVADFARRAGIEYP